MQSEHPTQHQEQVRTFNLRAALHASRWVSMWRLFAGLRPFYAGAIVALALAAAANTAGFFLIRYVVDEILPREGAIVGALALMAAGFLILAGLQGFFSFLSGKWAAHTAETIAQRIRDYLYDHFQRVPFRFHDTQATGELIQRSTSDVQAVQRLVAEQLPQAGRISFIFLVNFAGVLLIHPGLGIASVLVMPIIVGLSFVFFRVESRAYERFQDQESVLSTVLQENLYGVRVVKAFSRQDYEIDKFEVENRERLRLGRIFMSMHALYWPISDFIAGSQMLFAYFLGALLVLQSSVVIGPFTWVGGLSVGDYLAFAGMVVMLIFPIRQLGELIVQMSTGFVSYGRVLELAEYDREYLGLNEATPRDHAQIQGHIAFKGLNYGYINGEQVLHDISFEVQPGQTVALLGSTGSGKTSLMNLLPRFYDYEEGSITLDGVELKQYPRWFLRELIGIVEQEPFLFSRTIWENITYGLKHAPTEEEVFAAAKAANVHDVILGFPDGYHTLVGERGVTLSGGQKQRVALARTLITNPKILILDDATSSVDTETEGQIRQALQNMMGDRVTFLIAHRVQSVMLADQILVMDQGRIVQRGTHDELMQAEDGMYRRVYDMQASIEADLQAELAALEASEAAAD